MGGDRAKHRKRGVGLEERKGEGKRLRAYVGNHYDDGIYDEDDGNMDAEQDNSRKTSEGRKMIEMIQKEDERQCREDRDRQLLMKRSR